RRRLVIQTEHRQVTRPAGHGQVDRPHPRQRATSRALLQPPASGRVVQGNPVQDVRRAHHTTPIAPASCRPRLIVCEDGSATGLIAVTLTTTPPLRPCPPTAAAAGLTDADRSGLNAVLSCPAMLRAVRITSPADCCMPCAMPSIVNPPICANTFDGLEMPSACRTQSGMIEEKKPYRAFFSQSYMLTTPLQMPVMMAWPTPPITRPMSPTARTSWSGRSAKKPTSVPPIHLPIPFTRSGMMEWPIRTSYSQPNSCATLCTITDTTVVITWNAGPSTDDRACASSVTSCTTPGSTALYSCNSDGSSGSTAWKIWTKPPASCISTGANAIASCTA